LSASGHRGTIRVVDDEAVEIVITVLADFRAEVTRIRKETVEDDGEEEEEGRR
jgi:hypothetical protein